MTDTRVGSIATEVLANIISSPAEWVTVAEIRDRLALSHATTVIALRELERAGCIVWPPSGGVKALVSATPFPLHVPSATAGITILLSDGFRAVGEVCEQISLWLYRRAVPSGR